MAQHEHLHPGSFLLEGGSTGVLCVHGFSATPTEMRPVAEALHAKGLTVSAVQIAGHGTTVADLKKSRWQEWVKSVDDALRALKERCDQVFIVAQSAGVLMTQHVLLEHDDVKGLVALAPALYVKTNLLPASIFWRFIQKEVKKGEEDCLNDDGPNDVWSYPTLPTESVYQFYRLQRSARPLMKKHDLPLLVMYGKHDQTVHPRAPQLLHDLNAHDDKELVWLEKSAHMLTVDNERDLVSSKVAEWIHSRS